LRGYLSGDGRCEVHDVFVDQGGNRAWDVSGQLKHSRRWLGKDTLARTGRLRILAVTDGLVRRLVDQTKPGLEVGPHGNNRL
jgi:hypothetical protein